MKEQMQELYVEDGARHNGPDHAGISVRIFLKRCLPYMFKIFKPQFGENAKKPPNRVVQMTGASDVALSV